ncbi:MAG TPA: hypothetical protein VEQ66_06780 [Propionibacteriaceae bacterium]|nr:hypothetical protein [Propionibacteriaceae bacterium]
MVSDAASAAQVGVGADEWVDEFEVVDEAAAVREVLSTLAEGTGSSTDTGSAQLVLSTAARQLVLTSRCVRVVNTLGISSRPCGR